MQICNESGARDEVNICGAFSITVSGGSVVSNHVDVRPNDILSFRCLFLSPFPLVRFSFSAFFLSSRFILENALLLQFFIVGVSVMSFFLSIFVSMLILSLELFRT